MTLVEILLALGLAALVFALVFNALFFFFGRNSRSSVTVALDRAFAGQDVRIGLRKLILRLREGTEVLSPSPGVTARSLVFRDILNRKIRLRLDKKGRILRSEVVGGQDFLPETTAGTVDDGQGRPVVVAQPIRVPGCKSVSFTTLSPSCVVVTLVMKSRQVQSAMMTAVHLRNHRLAPRGEAS